MKKLVYSLLMAGLGLVGCTSFDDPVQEKYAAGPSAKIEVTAKTDSTFTFTVTPAEGAQYYSYIVVKSSEVQQLDAATLLKVAYSGIVAGEMTETAKAASVTNNMRNKKGEPLCLPNTTYQIYAVAVSDKGITGEIANTMVTTTDGLLPAPRSFKADTEKKSVAVTFSEAVARGEGEIVAMYYKEWDLTNPVVIDEKELEVSIEGNVVTFAAPKTYAGSIIAVSWADGAFVDSYGNKCSAMNSELDMKTGKFSGVNFRNDLVPFDMELMKEAEEEGEEPTGNLTVAPELGSSFADPSEFMAILTLDFDIYRNDDTAEAGDVQVVYKNGKKSTTINLPVGYWMTQENKLLFILPEVPEYGDYVGVIVNEGAIADVYGNPNNKFELEDAWLLSYGYKREMVLGNHALTCTSYFDDSQFVENLTIEADPETEDGVIISGFLTNMGLSSLTNPMKGTFNGDYATITIPEVETPIFENSVNEVYLYNAEGGSSIIAKVEADGSIVIQTLWGYYLYKKDGSAKGWLAVVVPGATSVKSEAASQSAKASSFSTTPFVPTIKSAKRILK